MKFKISTIIMLGFVVLHLLYFDVQLYQIGNAFEDLGKGWNVEDTPTPTTPELPVPEWPTPTEGVTP